MTTPDYVEADDRPPNLSSEYVHCEERTCDNVDEFWKIDKDYKYYIDGVALLIVAIFGTIGTIMSLIVLLKPRIITRREGPLTLSRTFSNVSQEKEKHFSNFLTALCIFDCSFLLLAIPYIGLPAITCW